MTSRFSFPLPILFGPGVIAQLPDELAKRGIRRPLLVTDPGLARTPVMERVRTLAPDAAEFTGVDANPTEANVAAGVAAYRDGACDGIVGLGGGSPLDAAKAIRLKVTHTRPLVEYDDLTGGDQYITADLPPMIAVATTSGTGSEVGRSTVITIEATNRKTVIFSPFLMASLAINDPELTVGLPPHVTAGTGMDAFTHNFEAYVARGYHPICDAIALEGVRLVWENLPKAMEQPDDIDARTNLMMASMMGAIAFQKGLGAVHSLAHPLSSDCGMHHGTTNAVLLPVVTEFNAEAAKERLARIGAILGGDPAERVRELNRRIGIQPRLRDYGVSEEILPKLADKAVIDGCHGSNPRACTRDDLFELYKLAW